MSRLDFFLEENKCACIRVWILRVENHMSCSKQTVEVKVLSSVELCFRHGKTTLQPLLLL